MADEIRYSADHVWVRPVGKKRARLGISEYVQEKIGEIDSITLTDVGDEIKKSDNFGEIESANTLFELLSPLTGNVVEVNEEVLSYPGLVNSDPLGDGWLIEIEMEDVNEFKELMDPDEYEEFLDRKSEEG
jgi:glycine cleavage system H protein